MINLEQDQDSLYHGGGGGIVIAFVQPQLSQPTAALQACYKNNIKYFEICYGY